MHVRSLGSIVLLCVLASCGDGTARFCEPGSTQRCVCAVGEGAQSCNTEGTSWMTCACGEPDGGADVDASRPDASSPDADVLADAGEMVDASVPACAVGATTATIEDVTSGAVGTGTLVLVDGVVAMSPVFLVSRSTTTGSCLWGAFVSVAGLTVTAPGTGILVTSFGTMAAIPPGGTTALCPIPGAEPNGSAIPDDLHPGDVLTVVGTTAAFLPSTCGSMPGSTTVAQAQIANACFAGVTGTAAMPTPALISGADVARLASPSDAAFHDQWGGVRIRVEDVSAAPPAVPSTTCSSGTSVVGRFGEITLATSGIVIGDRAYYVGGLASTDPCHAAPTFCTSGASYHWDVIEGFHTLDFCTWGISPTDKCADLSPQSADCVVASCAP